MGIIPCYSEHGRNGNLKQEFQFNFFGEPRVSDIITVSDAPGDEDTWKITRRQWKTNGRLILIVSRPHGVVPA